MRTSHYKWILLPSQPLVQNYTPKGLGISYTESLLKTNDTDTCLDKNQRDLCKKENVPNIGHWHQIKSIRLVYSGC